MSKILIIGAGIGGLTTALSLHKPGVDIHIFESSKEIKPLGVGINLLPHAVRVLTNLGLHDTLSDVAVATKELIYFNRFGQQIWQEPRGKFAGYHWPQFSLHRGSFQMILLEVVKKLIGKDHIHLGHHLQYCENKHEHVVANFIKKESGEFIASVEGDVLIGADGIHSVVRKQFYPDEGLPKFSGTILHRGTTMAKPFLSGASMIMAGSAEKKFVAYPILPVQTDSTLADANLNDVSNQNGSKQLINWIADLPATPEENIMARDWNRRADKQKLLSAFRGWHFDWLNIVSLIDGAEAIYEFPMSDRDPLPQWSFDRITLLGDAAHPMYPIGSNGASQAILDAECLSQSLRDNNDIATALKNYESIRIPLTAQIVLQNRQMGPEQVMQIVAERAPNGFTDLYDVISREELEEVAARYKRIAGFEKELLNQKQ